jgi:hypothetical protein
MKKILFCLLAVFFVNLNSYSQEDKRPVNYNIVIETDLVHDFGNGCYEVQVRVVYTFQGDFYSYTETWANVMVGNCPSERFVSQYQNENCDDIEFKGDFIINSKHIGEKCLIEYLKDEAIYEKYTEAKKRLISSIQK